MKLVIAVVIGVLLVIGNGNSGKSPMPAGVAKLIHKVIC